MGMHKYHLTLPDYTTNSAAISGNFLARNRHDAVAHAFLASDLFTGAKTLTKPTMLQAVHLARTNPTYAWWAFKRQAERGEIEAGLIPLVPAAPRHMNGDGTALTVPPVVPDINDVELIHIAQRVGTDRMLAAAMAAEVGH